MYVYINKLNWNTQINYYINYDAEGGLQKFIRKELIFISINLQENLRSTACLSSRVQQNGLFH